MKAILLNQNGTWHFLKNEEQLYYAMRISSWFKYKTIYGIFNVKKEQLGTSKYGRIELANSNQTIIWKRKSPLYKGYFTFHIGNDLYMITCHKIKPWHSIFKNGIQIGYAKKGSFSSFSSSEIEVVYNSNESDLLIFAILYSSICDTSNDSEALEFTIGAFFEKFPFDEAWMPK